MSVHLIGGGRDRALTAEVLSPFVQETTDAANGAAPVLAVLLVLEADDDTSVDRFRDAMVDAAADTASIRVAAIVEGDTFDAAVVDGAHGIFVGGGLTPAYHAALDPIADRIRALVSAGSAYAGFSAGAVVASRRALVGGYRSGGIAIAPEDAAEELDELEMRDGLGLTELTVDVHAAQWGTLSRLIAAVDEHGAPNGVAIDEHTAVVVTASGTAVRGAGQAWWVTTDAAGVVVSREAAAGRPSR